MQESPQARAIIETLHKAGFIAYYAGGWVRDFLLQRPSDDVDIATNAPPETVRALFPHTVALGIAFGIVLVIQEGHPFEVATFRQDLSYHDGRRPAQIRFATAEEDAKRRDFTINGLFYDPVRQQIIDYVGGQKDIEAGIIRAIGDPHERIHEDRLRMIRGIRLSCRFQFQIEKRTQDAIRLHAKELFPAVAIERVMQELAKGHAFGSLPKMLLMLFEFGLLAVIFPELPSVSCDQLKDYLEPTQYYPPSAPLIAFLLPMFPGYSLQEQMDLCKRLKLSNTDVKFVTFLFRAHQLIQESLAHQRVIENIEWAHFYAHKSCEDALHIIAAHLGPKQGASFKGEHQQRIALLQSSIVRIQNHTPVIQATDLLQEGISPGKQMGLLLKEAERIACNEQISLPATVIARLKMSPLWP
jgi:poly(A) polymerase